MDFNDFGLTLQKFGWPAFNLFRRCSSPLNWDQDQAVFINDLILDLKTLLVLNDYI